MLTISLIPALLIASAVAFPLEARDASDADIARLAPDLGVQRGVPFGDGSADCKGVNNARIPCQCPPTRDDFIKSLQADVHAGFAVHNPGVRVNFPTDDSTQSQLDRIQASVVVLQNLNGPGKGCPFVATTFGAQQDAIKAGKAVPPPAAAPPPPPPPAAPAPPPPSGGGASGSGGPSDADIARLAPDLGVQAGIPFGDGSADCKGVNNARIPCSCPPDRNTFIAALQRDVHAGHAVNNPSVGVSFPTGDDKQSKLGRIQASVVVLQNLNGPGKGCPFVATNFGAQQDAIKNGQDVPPPQAAAPPAPAPPAPTQAPAPPPPSGGGASGNSGKASDDDVARLAPDLGVQRGIPFGDGSADCKGVNNARIPCQCPPTRDDFIKSLQADVRAGFAVNNPSVKVSFPTDNSTQSQLARIQASVVALQNLDGPGKGCPFVATNFGAQQDAIKNGQPLPPAQAAPAPAPPAQTQAPAPPPPSGGAAAGNNGKASDADVARLAPDLGVQRGIPFGDGSADCKGINNSRIPCSCPPTRDDFIKSLQADVRAGFAVNNPGVKVSFPTGDDKQSKLDRIQASVVALQNLNGPGKGCPFVATTFGAQQDAIKAGKA